MSVDPAPSTVVATKDGDPLVTLNSSSDHDVVHTEYQEQRRQYLHSLYNGISNATSSSNANVIPHSAMSPITPSSTKSAASKSFIRDSTSPLFASSKVREETHSSNLIHRDSECKNCDEEKALNEPLDSNHSMQNPVALSLHDHDENIRQKQHIVPPAKMKKKASEQELQLVLEHFTSAQHKDFEAIFKQHEPKVIENRDIIYNEAVKDGVTLESDDMSRLKVLARVVEFAFMNIEPPNEYTKLTDRRHFKEVAAWACKFARDKDVTPPLTLIYTAWCHDIERFIPCTKCEYLPEAVDKYRKQAIHSMTSAKVAMCLLKGAPVTKGEKERIFQMILHHDMPHPRDDLVILGKTLIEGADDDLMWELELMMDADAFAFFQSTISYFIEFKAKKNSPDWIWERVCNNVKRLRPHLRCRAAQCIQGLAPQILSKMSVDWKELTHLCAPSGLHSNCPSDDAVSLSANSESVVSVRTDKCIHSASIPATPPTTNRLNDPSTFRSSSCPQTQTSSNCKRGAHRKEVVLLFTSPPSKTSHQMTVTVTPPFNASSAHSSGCSTNGHRSFTPSTSLQSKFYSQLLKDRDKNIRQKEHVIPPSKMKGKASIDELQLVLDHFAEAESKDFESILKLHEPKVLEFRDETYAQATSDGIGIESDDMSRLKVLGHVVEFAFMNIEPPNEYTKLTDRRHFKEVAAWACKFARDKDVTPPLTLIYTAWCHDIERFIPCTKCEYLPEAVDKYRKQVIHSMTSAKVAMCLLKGAPVTKGEKERIFQMILHHDMPHPKEDSVILGKTLIEGADDDLMWELELMMDADAFAFFQSTISYFIEFKAKKNSPDWIWERVCNNVKRLRPHLRCRAAQCIQGLAPQILSKMSVDWKELTHLCAPSGLHSNCPSDDAVDSGGGGHDSAHTTPRSSSVEIKTNHFHSDEDHEFEVVLEDEVDDVDRLGPLKVMKSANSTVSVASSASSLGVIH